MHDIQVFVNFTKAQIAELVEKHGVEGAIKIISQTIEDSHHKMMIVVREMLEEKKAA